MKTLYYEVIIKKEFPCLAAILIYFKNYESYNKLSVFMCYVLLE